MKPSSSAPSGSSTASSARRTTVRLPSCRGTCRAGSRKGRSNIVTTKLDPDRVREIRRRSAEPRTVLAAEFGVTPATIGSVIFGRTWKWVSDSGDISEEGA